MPEKKNVAAIGAGAWGRNIVRTLHSMGRLAAVAETAPALREQVEKDYPAFVESGWIGTGPKVQRFEEAFTVGQGGFVVPQRNQLLIHPSQLAVLAVVDLVPLQPGAFEGRRVLRVGDLVGVPPVLGELTLAALGGGPGQIRFRMAAEELKRR